MLSKYRKGEQERCIEDIHYVVSPQTGGRLIFEMGALSGGISRSKENERRKQATNACAIKKQEYLTESEPSIHLSVIILHNYHIDFT